MFHSFRGLYDVLSEGDIAVVDRYFSGCCDIALPLQRGIDIVVHKHPLCKWITCDAKRRSVFATSSTRRPKPYKHLREPRQNYRSRMLRGG